MSYSILSRYRAELMGTAILWVMLFHSFDLDLGLPLLNAIRAAGFGGVDIFILLSALGLAVSLSRREQEYAAFMRRRASRILPAYYLVMIPYTVFFILCYKAGWSGLVWNCLLLYYWTRPAAAFNWYVAGAVTFYAVTPLCFHAMRRCRRPALWTAAAILISFAANAALTHDGYWQYIDISFRVPVFFLGLLLGFYVAEDRRLGWKDALFWCAWLCVGTAYMLVRSFFRLEDYLPTCPLFLFSTVPMCFALCWCMEKLPLNWLCRALHFLGTHSLEIYLLNISVFAEVTLLRQLVRFGPSNRLYYLLSYAVNIAAAVLLRRAVEALKQLWARRTPPGV